MIRVLQLLPSPTDASAWRSADLLRRAAPADVAITHRTVGSGGDYRSAPLAAMSLRFGRERFELIHAWGERVLPAALMGRVPIIFTPSITFSKLPRWLMPAIRRRPVHVVCESSAMHQAIVRGGALPEACHVIQPWAPALPRKTGRDEALCQELGIRPDDRIVLAPGESTRESHHGLAVHAVSILHVLDRRYRLLLWGRGPMTRCLFEMGNKLRQPDLVIRAEQQLGRPLRFEQLLATAQLVMATGGPADSMLPLAQCMAGRLPIVATDSSAAPEFIEDGKTGIVVHRAGPRRLARCALDLFENPARAERLAHAARVDAETRFDRSLFCHALFSLCRRILGRGDALEISGPSARTMAPIASS